MPQGVEGCLQAIERGLPSIHRRLLSAEDARDLLRRNLEEIRASAPNGGALAGAEEALTSALEELLRNRNPAADENRDQSAEDRRFERVVEAFESYARAVGQGSS